MYNGKYSLINNEIMAPPKIQKGGVEMSVLRQKELLLLLKGGARVDAMVLRPVFDEKKLRKYFEVFITLATTEGADEYLMLNAKNEPQRWASLNRVVDSFAELMPSLNEVVVKINAEE